jgi:hypothetical protein
MKTINKVIALSLLAILLASCNTFAATPTVTPTLTETSLPTSTYTPEPTLTLTPTDTPLPQPASLTGTILLSGYETKPFISQVELRQKDSFILMGKSETDAGGIYRIENIDPGLYELWVFITTGPEMVPGCADVAPPDNSWKIGIKFDEDKALSMENAYLSKGLLLAENINSSDLVAQAFFAVLADFEIKSGVENLMDVILICK